MEEPLVYSYRDFRRYLADWQVWAQATNPEMTKSEVSRRLGLPRTRSYFTDILGGRRVSGSFVDRFLRVLGLERDESRFFRTLVRFNQAQTPEDREIAFDELVALSRVHHKELDESAYRYYRHWWIGAIRAFVATGDFTEDPEPISRVLTPRVTPGQVRDALQLLLEQGLVERDEQGFLRPTERHLSTPEQSRNEFVKQLQIQQMGVVQSSLMAGDDPERRVFTNTISVTNEGMALILEHAERFRRAISAIVHQEPDSPTRVLQITVSLVPLSKQASPC